MRLTHSIARGTAGVALLGSFGLSMVLVPVASAGSSGPMATTMLLTGPTGNTVEMVAPAQSTYRPNIAGASVANRDQAQRLLDGVNRFCRNHTVAGIQAKWRQGTGKMSGQTHYYNPDPMAAGLSPRNPRAALIYDGRLGGVMFTGMPLPSLGSIPRAHSHDMTMPVEMVHVYCTKNLRDAFTPNRILGVKADLKMLRLEIRPAVMNLNKNQLHAVRAKVRGYAGDKLQAVSPVGTSSDGGPDPVLQAMRTEIRNSLMILTEHQLRSVWSLMQSY